MEMVKHTVLSPPRMPREPELELVPATLGEGRSWAWIVRSEGRIVGYGLRRRRERAIERALECFPDARLSRHD